MVLPGCRPAAMDRAPQTPRARPAARAVADGRRASASISPTPTDDRPILSPLPSSPRVWSAEEVAECFPAEQRRPPTTAVLWPVMDHVTALAEGGEVTVGVVGGVVVPMRSRQDYPRSAHGGQQIDGAGEAREPPSPVTPAASLYVPPASVAEVAHHTPVRSSADVAASTSSAEADGDRQLAPVDRVEEAVFVPDRHGAKIGRIKRSGRATAD